MNAIATSILRQSLLEILVLASIAGLVLGATLLLRPDWVARASRFANRWISTRGWDVALDRKVALDDWFYRHRKPSGALLLLGAFYILFFFTVQFDKTAAIAMGAKRYALPAPIIEGLIDAMVLSALAGALFTVFVSLFLLFRPSMMREMEGGANQWLSLRRALKPLEISRSGVDEMVGRHRQAVGALLILGSLYILVMLTISLS